MGNDSTSALARSLINAVMVICAGVSLLTGQTPSPPGSTRTMRPIDHARLDGDNRLRAGLLFIQEKGIIDALNADGTDVKDRLVADMVMLPDPKGILFRATLLPQVDNEGKRMRGFVIARLDVVGDQAPTGGGFGGFARGSVFRFVGEIEFPFRSIFPEGFGLGNAVVQRNATEATAAKVPLAVQPTSDTVTIHGSESKPLALALTSAGLVYLYGEGEFVKRDGSKVTIRELTQ